MAKRNVFGGPLANHALHCRLDVLGELAHLILGGKHEVAAFVDTIVIEPNNDGVDLVGLELLVETHHIALLLCLQILLFLSVERLE